MWWWTTRIPTTRLRNLISTARELSPSGRIITLFGAGGDRDRTKRPLMGEAAGSLSDLVVLTSDNPRSEDPLRVINDVVVGLQKVNAKYRIEPDRERALAIAIDEARAGDIVLLAGKGHETSQVLKDRTIEFDDREKAREILRRKGFSRKHDRAVKRGFASRPGALGNLRLRGKPSPLETQMRWTVVQAAEALGVAAPAGLDPLAGLAGVSIDSRTVQPGELFVAIHGPRHDGHDHVASALEKGAAAGLVARERLAEYPKEIQGRVFAVDDTLAALQRLASRACEIWRKQRPGRLIAGVAGSVGKTTTKEILAALVGARFRVLKTQGNLNNEYGLPLTLLKLDDEYEAAVVELGMSHQRRAGALDAHRLSGCGRGDARGGRASGIFRLDRRDCAGRAGADRKSAVAERDRGTQCGRRTRGALRRSGARSRDFLWDQRGGGFPRRSHRRAWHRGIGI